MSQIRSTCSVALVAATFVVTVLTSPTAQAAAEPGTAPAKARIEQILRQ